MTREIIETSLKVQVFTKYGERCYVCGYSLKSVLRIHHVIPVSLGGADNLDNLILVCSNCHTLTHFFSSKKYQNKEIESLLIKELNKKAVKRLKELIGRIHQAKEVVEKNGNLWIETSEKAQAAYEVDDALERVARRNKFTVEQKNLLADAFQLVLRNIPNDVFNRCSYRLLDKGRCISINIMNYLLFRSPAYGDLGRKPDYDCYVIFPNNLKALSGIDSVANREFFYFKNFDCINVEMSYDALLSLSAKQWKLFQDACEMALSARRTREWVSNIKVA